MLSPEEDQTIRSLRRWVLAAGAAVLVLIASIGLWLLTRAARAPRVFDGARALRHVEAQVALGDRSPGQPGNRQTADYIRRQLESAGWAVEFQDFDHRGVVIRNVIARANVGRGPLVILGAHYDTRRVADQDALSPQAPVPGANDGASGVAVLLELGRSLELERVPSEVWLTFFDAEDQGGLEEWDWIVGSTHMADSLRADDVGRAAAMILVDMVGDADQQFYWDGNSDPALSAEIWALAASLGYGQQFRPIPRWSMLDDHVPFVRRGIPAVDIIDFDYPAWHTTADTIEEVSSQSLERVGRTLTAYLETQTR